MSLTKKEKRDIKALVQASFGLALDDLKSGRSFNELLNDTANVLIAEIEQKKKEWQEEAVRKHLDEETKDALSLD